MILTKTVEVYFWLLFAHFYGDVILRSPFISRYKSKSFLVLLFHCFMWSGCICLVLVAYHIFSFWKVLFLFVGHFVTDLWKISTGTVSWEKRDKVIVNRYTIIDQFVHFLQLFVVGYF